MKPAAWICLSLGLIFTQHAAADTASTPILVGNTDNQIALLPAASVPQVLRLAGSGGTTWQGMDAETFVGSATIDGVAVALHWRFDPGASRIRSDSVSLAYADRSTGLRLYWEWRATARHGPIEHVIRIENPGRHEVWIEIVGPAGTPTRRRVRPVTVEGGRVRAIDVERESELTIAVHRIASVSLIDAEDHATA